MGRAPYEGVTHKRVAFKGVPYKGVTHKRVAYKGLNGERAVHERRAMSLIRVRNQRKKNWIDKKKHSSPRRLAILLIMLFGVIWWLGFRF